MVGYGGVIRDHDGNFLFGFAQKLDSTTVLEAELMAIYHGLCLAWGRGKRRIVLQSESQAALELIEDNFSCSPLSLTHY